MDDGMKRVSREHLEPYFRLHKEANFNMIRNWTGESTEEVFYQLCDEYGMLVFNDFWLSTQGYNMPVNDDDLFLRNAEDVVKRFRNHPSIAIWNPRNEGFAPEYIEKRLAEMIARVDGTRYYTVGITGNRVCRTCKRGRLFCGRQFGRCGEVENSGCGHRSYNCSNGDECAGAGSQCICGNSGF